MPIETNKIYHCDILDGMKMLDDKSINCCITSPPYWQLRDYGFDGQWGLEKTFAEYLEHLWQFMDELHRVLRDDGTAWINLGDSYGTQGGKNTGKDHTEYDSTYMKNRNGANGEPNAKLIKGDAPHKCLLLIPHRFAIGCIDRNWLVRNDIIWAKPNGMPESVIDRFTKKHEFIFLLVKSEKYYFDLDGIRSPYTEESIERYNYPFTGNKGSIGRDMVGYPSGMKQLNYSGDKEPQFKGKNPGDVSDFWKVTTKGSTNDDHYAAYNSELIDKPIVAGCPEHGIILDPFCGTATTGIRALQLNRKFIGFEGSKKYFDAATRKFNLHLSQQKLF